MCDLIGISSHMRYQSDLVTCAGYAGAIGDVEVVCIAARGVGLLGGGIPEEGQEDQNTIEPVRMPACLMREMLCCQCWGECRCGGMVEPLSGGSKLDLSTSCSSLQYWALCRVLPVDGVLRCVSC